MSIIFMDGFDYIQMGFGRGGIKWDQGSQGSVDGYGRFPGSGTLHPGSSGNAFIGDFPGAFHTFSTTKSSIIIGYAQKFDSFSAYYGGNDGPFMMFSMNGNRGNTGYQCSLRIHPTTQTICLYQNRGQDLINDVLMLDTGFVPPLTLWYYLETKITFSGSSGSCEIRVNGTPVGSVSGVPTATQGYDYINRFHLCNLSPFGASWYCDDLYVIDPNDATDNIDFLGEVRVQTKYPDANGYQNDFFKSQETIDSPPRTAINSDMVNSHPIYYTENGYYNYSGTVGAKDLYSIGNFTVSGTIFAVQENISIRKDDVGNRNMCPLLRTASQEFEGPSYACFSDYTYGGKIWEMNPVNGNPWALTDLNLAEFGVKIKS